ncbi:MAG TPA: hypothetical protein VNB06_05600 [Thermoanaerobaculia bacterium]|nr:hypothetical protein [Thermoanaerobaculia bacterium]
MERALSRLEVLPTTLAFDSASGPGKRGLRKGPAGSRHLLFEADDLCLDLRLESDSTTGSITVHGQVADRRDPLKGLGGNPVYLLSGDRVAAWLFGNGNGEFVFEVPPRAGLLLCLPIMERGQILIALDPLCSQEAANE